MADVTLSTGEIVSIDTAKITWGEWRRFFNGKDTQKDEAAFIEKATGIAPEKQDAMLRDDMRRIIQGIIRVGSQPLADPNSQSASTSG